jgi:hypothetical protein
VKYLKLFKGMNCKRFRDDLRARDIAQSLEGVADVYELVVRDY